MNIGQSADIAAAGGIIEPIALERFFEEYWEKKPLHIGRSSTNPFASLISIKTIEELLSTNALYFPSVQLSHAGQSIPISEYTDGNNSIVSNRVIERYRNGSTIVISQAHRLVSNLMALCRTIETSLMMRCQTNVYLSPAGNQGFNPHYDTHDVFILQVSGRKTFNFYSSGANLPSSGDKFNSDIHTVGEKTEEVQLSGGDTLYIPRGIVHDAVADTDEPSLHITLGVYPVLLNNVIEEITHIAFESDARLRAAVLQSDWMLDTNGEQTMHLIKQLVQEHINIDVVRAALQRLRDDVAVESIPDNEGLLSKAMEPAINLNAKLVVQHHKILQIESHDKMVILRLHGQVVEFSDSIGVAVQWVLNQDEVCPQELPGLVQEQKLALTAQLRGLGVLSQ